jgi:hypothetical protein
MKDNSGTFVKEKFRAVATNQTCLEGQIIRPTFSESQTTKRMSGSHVDAAERMRESLVPRPLTFHISSTNDALFTLFLD